PARDSAGRPARRSGAGRRPPGPSGGGRHGPGATPGAGGRRSAGALHARSGRGQLPGRDRARLMTGIAYCLLWIFVFCVPWEGVIRIGGVSIASRASGALAVVICVLTVVISGRIRRWHRLHFAALAFVLSAGLSILLQGSAQKLPNKYFTFIQL